MRDTRLEGRHALSIAARNWARGFVSQNIGCFRSTTDSEEECEAELVKCILAELDDDLCRDVREAIRLGIRDTERTAAVENAMADDWEEGGDGED